MPSILPNFEYDIFISYRQNDNKRDGWVTNFVAALKDELEATLKNPVSIYFDENPHDGLLETHQVNASLEKKLKCLVFIPIISQTYCDIKSYAWTQEFLPFLKLANEDELGMNITLSNGNVVSRVLPVRIHDLEIEDQAALEALLDGPLRPIDFIYREPGVNSPLKPDDDRNRNLENTDYKYQLNKVANSLKDIGNSILKSGDPVPEQPMAKAQAPPTRKGNPALRMIVGSILIPIVFALGYYGYRAFTDENTPQVILEKSIAILPFTDMSPDKDQEWFSAGLTEELNNSLANVPDLIVRARTSASYLQDQNLSLQKIADSLNVKYILQGSVRKMDDKLKISTQLIEAETGTNLWSSSYDRTMSDIFIIQKDISENIAQALDIILDDEKRSRMYSSGTRNVEAYEAYLKGDVYYKLAHTYSATDSSLFKANEYYEEAIAFDPTFAQAYARHQDFYSHYFVDGKHGIYNYVFEGLSDQDISRFIISDLESAIKNSTNKALKITYQLDQIFFSDNWQPALPLMAELESLEEEEQMVVRNTFSWFTHLFSYKSPAALTKLYMVRINNDPYDGTAANLFTSSLMRMNLMDSVASYFDNNEIYLQNSLAVVNKRAMAAIMSGDYQRAYSVMETCFLNQELEVEEFSELYVLSKILVGDTLGLPMLDTYLDNIELRAIAFYNIAGQYDKADSLARAFDSKFLGPSIISRYLNLNPLLFHLSATPNFSARLKELGIDPVKFEEGHYIKLATPPVHLN